MMQDPRLKALLDMIQGNSMSEFSEEGENGLEIKIEAEDAEGAEDGLKIAKETLGKVQNLTTMGKKKRRG